MTTFELKTRSARTSRAYHCDGNTFVRIWCIALPRDGPLNHAPYRETETETDTQINVLAPLRSTGNPEWGVWH